MPINELIGRHRELGRLKFGEDAGDRPRTLDTWRLTSPHPDLLEAAARAHGGHVEPRGDGEGFELTTDTDTLEVLLPRQDIAAGQWLELWTAGGLKRRCDGTTLVTDGFDQAAGRPCECDPEARECKPTTVLRVVLPELPDLGVWRLTTRSYYAAAELPQAAALLYGTSTATLVPAVLALEERKTKRTGERTKRYTVPVLRTNATLTELLAGHHPQLETIHTLDTAGPIAELDVITGELRPLSPSESHESPNRAPVHPEEPLEPIPTPWRDLAAFLVTFHPSALRGRSTGDLIEALITLEELMVAAGLWHITDEGISPLDIAAGRHFDTEGTERTLWRDDIFKTDRLRAFAQRAAMAAHTATNDTRLGARALEQAEADTQEEDPTP